MVKECVLSRVIVFVCLCKCPRERRQQGPLASSSKTSCSRFDLELEELRVELKEAKDQVKEWAVLVGRAVLGTEKQHKGKTKEYEKQRNYWIGVRDRVNAEIQGKAVRITLSSLQLT